MSRLSKRRKLDRFALHRRQSPISYNLLIQAKTAMGSALGFDQKEIEMLTTLKTKLRALLRKSEVERELDEELRYHIEQQVEQNVRLGMNPEEARQAALKSFGGVEQAEEGSGDERCRRCV